MGTQFLEGITFFETSNIFFISHRDKSLEYTLESFIRKPVCFRTAAPWLGQAFLACRKPAFRTLFWIRNSIGEKPKPLGSYLF